MKQRNLKVKDKKSNNRRNKMDGYITTKVIYVATLYSLHPKL